MISYTLLIRRVKDEMYTIGERHLQLDLSEVGAAAESDVDVLERQGEAFL